MSNRPKRRVERVFSRIIDTGVSDTAESVVLHTCEDAKTLVRAMGVLRVSPIDTAMTTTVYLEAVLNVAPGATTVVTAGDTQSLDEDPPLQHIGTWVAEAMQNDTNGILVTDKIEFDTKAMRKLKAGDTVKLGYIASTANDLRLRGIVYLWFKE